MSKSQRKCRKTRKIRTKMSKNCLNTKQNVEKPFKMSKNRRKQLKMSKSPQKCQNPGKNS